MVDEEWRWMGAVAMISQCPQCGYSLQGLPEKHQCPECGLRYDAGSEVYRYINPKRLLFGGLCSVLVFCVMADDLVNRSWTNHAWPWLSILAILFLVAINALSGYACIQTYRYGALVAVLPDGLYPRLQGDCGSLTPWAGADVRWAVPDRRGKRATVRIGERLTPRQIAGVFKTKADALRLSQRIEQRMRQSRSAVNDEEGGRP